MKHAGLPLLPLLLALALLPLVSGAAEPEFNPVRRSPTQISQPTDRIIVKFRAVPSSERMQAQSVTAESRAGALAKRMNLRLKNADAIADRMQALQLDSQAASETTEQTLERLRNDPDVEYAQLDRRRYAQAVPNDPLYANQWFLKSAVSTPSAINAEQAWDITTGSASVVVAILDTGVRFDHPDLQAAAAGGRLLPGYDFVSADPGTTTSFRIANDGNGRDSDPTDPGDWVDSADMAHTVFADCETSPSSWHGTRVAGLVGAKTNNAIGVAGVTWTSPLLPVRVLGKCGGRDSDILAGMLWAGGVNVSGVPLNPNPARIINMSLGGEGACSSAYADVISQLTARGVLVVVSAGNDAGHAVTEPANCAGVLAVAGLRHAGTKVGFSNIGPEIGISAPGGNCVNTSGACLNSLDTTTNLGTSTPQLSGYTDSFNANLGTSFSAPIVAGVAALLRSMNSQLTPAQTIIRLQRSATAFPVASGVSTCQDPASTTGDQLECNCTTSTCGAGMVNAAAAVTAAQKPYVVISATPTSPANGQTVNLSSAGTFVFTGRTITSYSWTVASTGGSTPTIAGANTANASFTAPSAGAIVLRLTVTDSVGDQDFADVTVNTPAATAPVTPTPPASSGGGGGGAFLLFDLLFLLGFSSYARYRLRD